MAIAKPEYKELLEAGVHFGHLKKKWNPRMAPYIFMEKKGIHIIDLNKTISALEEACAALKSIAKSGKKILFIATKKQAKNIVAAAAQQVNMPYTTERWLGGMLTNFATIKKSIKKIESIKKMLADGTLENITKKEKLNLTRQKEKMEKVLGGVAMLNRLPAALFIVDISHEHIALAEARKLNVSTFGIVDTNSDPREVDFAIPANDDASKSIDVICKYVVEAIKDGLKERKEEKDSSDDEDSNNDEQPKEKKETAKAKPPVNETKKPNPGGRRRTTISKDATEKKTVTVSNKDTKPAAKAKKADDTDKKVTSKETKPKKEEKAKEEKEAAKN